jgi:hypothetical protein
MKTDSPFWSTSEAQRVCKTFLPPNASFQLHMTTFDGHPEDVYFKRPRLILRNLRGFRLSQCNLACGQA